MRKNHPSRSKPPPNLRSSGCGPASIGLGIETAKSVENVTHYCGAFRYWRRPLETEELMGEVLAIVRITASEAAT